MSLAKRIIPTLLCRGRTLVKGVAFDAWRSVGHAAQAVRIHQQRGVDELVLLDIAATPENRGPDLALVEELSGSLFCPLAVGGGVRTLEDVRMLLRAGADKVVIGQAANTDVVQRAAETVGSQAIVVAIDVYAGAVGTRAGMRAWSNGPSVTPVQWARLMEADGAGEIMLTATEREGAMAGYDLDLIRSVSQAVSIPVIAHGGAGTYEHMAEAIEAGADAVAAGSMFLFTESTPRGAAEYLAQHGHVARI